VDSILSEMGGLRQAMRETKELGTTVYTLKQDMKGLTDMELSTRKTADSLVAGIHELQKEFQTFSATARTDVPEKMEPLSQSGQKTKELPLCRSGEHACLQKVKS